MTVRPEISIIVPCYNYGNYLSETLESVVGQTFTRWECIVVDDGSTDNTKDVVCSYTNRDNRFVYVYQENKGLSSARNSGIKAATGDYIQLLDADDLIENQKLEAQIHCFRNYPEADIVYGEVRFFDTEKPLERRFAMWGDNVPWMPMVSGSGKQILAPLLAGNIMVVCSPLIRKEVFDTCGLFDETLSNHEDWEFWLRCALGGEQFVFLDSINTHALVRYHPDSMSRNRMKMYETNIAIREKLFTVLNDHDLYRINKKLYREMGLVMARENILNKKIVTGITQIFRFLLNRSGW